MKMPTMNFDFGPFTESGVVALSPYGIPCDSEGRELATLNQNASKANDNW